MVSSSLDCYWTALLVTARLHHLPHRREAERDHHAALRNRQDLPGARRCHHRLLTCSVTSLSQTNVPCADLAST